MSHRDFGGEVSLAAELFAALQVGAGASVALPFLVFGYLIVFTNIALLIY